MIELPLTHSICSKAAALVIARTERIESIGGNSPTVIANFMISQSKNGTLACKSMPGIFFWSQVSLIYIELMRLF
jgi:hypothetical protein